MIITKKMKLQLKFELKVFLQNKKKVYKICFTFWEGKIDA